MDKLVEKCLPDSVMNRLRKIIFDVLYKNAPYNQGIIASEILEQAIPIIAGEIKKDIEGLSETPFNSYYDIKIISPRWQDYWNRGVK